MSASVPRQLFRSPPRSANARTAPSPAAQTLLAKALAAQTCIDMNRSPQLRRALSGSLEEVLRAGREGLTPGGIDAAIEVVSVVSEAAQKGKYETEGINSVAERVARFPHGAADEDAATTEVVFASPPPTSTDDEAPPSAASASSAPILALPPALESFLRSATDKVTSDKPRPQPRPGTSLRTAQPEATPERYGINGLGGAANRGNHVYEYAPRRAR